MHSLMIELIISIIFHWLGVIRYWSSFIGIDMPSLLSNKEKHNVIFHNGYKYCFEKQTGVAEYYHCEQ